MTILDIASWSSLPIWLPPGAALCSSILILALRRELRMAQQVCLAVALIAALVVVNVKYAAGTGPIARSVPAVLSLPVAVLGWPAVFKLTGASLTIIIFVLIAFLFSLSWLFSARPGGKNLFWLSAQFAFIWGLVTASDLVTIFIFTQLLMVPQYFLNLGPGSAHHRRIARRMLIAGLVVGSLILAAAILINPVTHHPRVSPDHRASLTALICILTAVWISLSLFPFHSVQTARITLDGQNLLPLNSNVWAGLALMIWLQRSLFVPQLDAMTWPLAAAATTAMAACSVACFAQRELSRSMAYAAAAVSALAFLAWLSRNTMGIVGSVLILGVLPVTVFGFQRGLDLLYLQAHDISASRDGRSASRGATHLLFLLLTAACIGMPATAIFRGVWFALIGMIKVATSAGRIEFRTVIFGVLALTALVPMILGVISRSLLAFRDPTQNIRQPDFSIYAGGIGTSSDSDFTAPLNLSTYIRTARLWAIFAMVVSLTLGLFPILATGPLLRSLKPPNSTSAPPRPQWPKIPPFHAVIVEYTPFPRASAPTTWGISTHIDPDHLLTRGTASGQGLA